MIIFNFILSIIVLLGNVGLPGYSDQLAIQPDSFSSTTELAIQPAQLSVQEAPQTQQVEVVMSSESSCHGSLSARMDLLLNTRCQFQLRIAEKTLDKKVTVINQPSLTEVRVVIAHKSQIYTTPKLQTTHQSTSANIIFPVLARHANESLQSSLNNKYFKVSNLFIDNYYDRFNLEAVVFRC